MVSSSVICHGAARSWWDRSGAWRDGLYLDEISGVKDNANSKLMSRDNAVDFTLASRIRIKGYL